jgi:L-iditol 2-dehydrogenase
MKALELHGPNNLHLVERPDPEPGPGGVLLRVMAVGVCGSDLHYYKQGRIGSAEAGPGFVLGHEFAGVIEALGEGVSRRQLSVGDRVAADPAIPCGKCEFCLKGDPNLCANLRFAGQPPEEDGALRQLMPWPATCCFKLPDALSAADGAMLEPLGVALHSVDLAKIRLGDTVVIIGCGPIGLLTLQCARLVGAGRIIALDKLAYRLSAARDMGADDTLLVTEGGHIESILDWTGGRGADVVLEAAGDSDAMRDAVEMARRGGRVVWVGIPPEDYIAFQASSARRKGLTMKLVRRMKHTYPRAIALVESGKIDARSLVTHTFPLEEGPKAFDLAAGYADGVIKAIIEPNVA